VRQTRINPVIVGHRKKKKKKTNPTHPKTFPRGKKSIRKSKGAKKTEENKKGRKRQQDSEKKSPGNPNDIVYEGKARKPNKKTIKKKKTQKQRNIMKEKGGKNQKRRRMAPARGGPWGWGLQNFGQTLSRRKDYKKKNMIFSKKRGGLGGKGKKSGRGWGRGCSRWGMCTSKREKRQETS